MVTMLEYANFPGLGGRFRFDEAAHNRFTGLNDMAKLWPDIAGNARQHVINNLPDMVIDR